MMLLVDDLATVTWESVRFVTREELGDDMTIVLTDKGVATLSANVGQVDTDELLFGAIASAMRFPAYFGMNWDAFEECLRDMEWLPAKGYVLVLWESAQLWHKSARTAGKLVESWLLAAEEGEGAEFPFTWFL